ncbi:MAG: hypothetical protein HZC29_07165 [Thaumarchaeota archaeon]|nr:hypothetical protein [Nitrososphaerota archaeon]
MRSQIVAVLVASMLLLSVVLPISADAAEKKIKKQTKEIKKKKLKSGFEPFKPMSKPEEPAKMQQDKTKLQTKSSTKTLDLSGRWSGTAVWSAAFDYYDPDIGSYREVCRYQGSFLLILQQSGNSITGDASLGNVQVTQGRNMDVCAEGGFSTLGAVNAKLFGSGFSGTVGGLGIKGSVTSDLISGQVSGSLGGEVGIDGKFTGNRAR